MSIEIGSFVFWPNKDSGIHQFGRLLFRGPRTSTIYLNARFGGKIVSVNTDALSLLNEDSMKIFGGKEKIEWVQTRINEMKDNQPKEIIQPLSIQEFNELAQTLFKRLQEIKEVENLNWSTSVLIKTAKHLAYQEKNQLYLRQLSKEKTKT